MIAFICALVLIGLPMAYFGIKTVYNFIYNGEENVNHASKTVQIEPTPQTSPNGGNFAVVTAQSGATIQIRKDLYDALLPQKDYHDIVNDENIRPAMVVLTPQGCTAHNRYGDVLAVGDDYCRLMADNHALIPRTRQQYNHSDSSQPKSQER